MKTIPQLERRQKELLRELEGIRNKRTQDKKDKTKIKKICKELEVIRLCVRYLETDPEPGFVQSELGRIHTEIKIHQDRFPIWAGQPENIKLEPAKAKRTYEKMVEMKSLRDKLNTMKYINQ